MLINDAASVSEQAAEQVPASSVEEQAELNNGEQAPVEGQAQLTKGELDFMSMTPEQQARSYNELRGKFTQTAQQLSQANSVLQEIFGASNAEQSSFQPQQPLPAMQPAQPAPQANPQAEIQAAIKAFEPQYNAIREQFGELAAQVAVSEYVADIKTQQALQPLMQERTIAREQVEIEALKARYGADVDRLLPQMAYEIQQDKSWRNHPEYMETLFLRAKARELRANPPQAKIPPAAIPHMGTGKGTAQGDEIPGMTAEEIAATRAMGQDPATVAKIMGGL